MVMEKVVVKVMVIKIIQVMKACAKTISGFRKFMKWFQQSCMKWWSY